LLLLALTLLVFEISVSIRPLALNVFIAVCFGTFPGFVVFELIEVLLLLLEGSMTDDVDIAVF
jgi:hypothetical protein